MSVANGARRVCVVGAGVMGLALIVRLLANGFEVSVYDPSPEAHKVAGDEGAKCVAKAQELFASGAPVIICVASPGAFRATIDAAIVALEDHEQPGIVIDVSTLPLLLKEDARARLTCAGAILVDCTLSGTAAQARNGDVVIFASGDKATLTQCESIFSTIARKFIQVGDFGMGIQLKLIANHLVGLHVAAACEALMLAKKAGLDVGVVLEVLTESAATSRMLEVRGPLMVKEKYTPATGSVDIIVKDGNMIKEMASRAECALPLFDRAHGLFSEVQANGLGNVDTAYLYNYLAMRPATSEDPQS